MKQELLNLRKDIDNLESRTRFELNSLPSFEDSNDSRGLGKEFKKQVKSGMINNIIHLGLTGDRHDYYEKL